MDYSLPLKDETEISKHIGKHFQIEYALDKKSYMLKDLGNGYGAFVRLDFPQVLKDNNLLSVGESFIVVNLIDEPTGGPGLSPSDPIPETPPQVPTGPKLRLKIFSGPSNGEIL